MINIIFGMPGVNCAVVGCGSCRGTKGIGIFKLPSAKDDKHKRWRDEWVGELKKTREVDEDFRRKINEDKVYACEKHFKDEVIEICKYFPSINSDLNYYHPSWLVTYYPCSP